MGQGAVASAGEGEPPLQLLCLAGIACTRSAYMYVGRPSWHGIPERMPVRMMDLH